MNDLTEKDGFEVNFLVMIRNISHRMFYNKIYQNRKGEMMKPKTLKMMGWIATGTAMLMYISYLPQIIHNIHGVKSGFLQPMVAAINCVLWVSYGFFQEKKDWPIVIANLPGVILGTIAAMTAL